ncbi:MAG: hypothetical protein U0414_02570 [Polyangiaceae bacterium]
MAPDVEVQSWTSVEIDRMASALDRAAEIAEPTLRAAAVETAFAFRCAGRALEWADDSDIEVLADVVARLESLRVDANRILAAIARLTETASEDEKTVVRSFASHADEPTVVREPLWTRVRRRAPPRLNPPQLGRRLS